MKKRSFFAAVICSILMIAGMIVPVHADGARVVTLGADLSEAQKQTMLRYFKVNANEVQILTVTNQDERNHLAGYIPLSQIGTRTFSCAYVKPTNSGGIKVRTANLNYVTGNMIASSLTTAGVRNCEVIAACPFPVSGTGALTGIQMAYEHASGEPIRPDRAELAVQEIHVTEELASVVGNNNATNVINGSKIEIIQNNITDTTEIYNIVVNNMIQNDVHVSEDQLNEIVGFMEEISQQDYDYDDMKDTLEQVAENLNDFYEEGYEEEAADAEEVYDEDSILNDIDESELGEGVAVSSTEDQSLEADTYDEEIENGSGEVAEGSWDDVEWSDDGWEDENVDNGGWEDENVDNGGWEDENVDNGGWEDENVDNGGWDDENTGDDGWEEEPVETENDLSALSEQAQSQYDQAERFCRGEYQGDSELLSDIMGSDFTASVEIYDSEVASRLSGAVLDKYYEILRDGTGSFVPDENSTYMSDELNMMDQFLRKLFSIDGAEPDGEDILADLSADEKMLIYGDTRLFFEKMYGEESYYGEEAYAEESYDDSYDDSYDSSNDDYSYSEEEYPAEEGWSEETYDEGYEDYSEDSWG